MCEKDRLYERDLNIVHVKKIRVIRIFRDLAIWRQYFDFSF